MSSRVQLHSMLVVACLAMYLRANVQAMHAAVWQNLPPGYCKQAA